MSTQNPQTGEWETNPIEGAEKEGGGRAFALSDGRDGPPVPAMAEHPPGMLPEDAPVQQEAEVPREESTLPAPKLIFETTELSDDQGRRITRRNVLHGNPPENFVRYVGHHAITIPPEMIPLFGGQSSSPYRFPIEDATTDTNAFERWEHWARHYGAIHIKQIEAEIRRSQEPGIVIPGAGQAPPNLRSREN